MFVKPQLCPIFLYLFVFSVSFSMEHPVPEANFAQEKEFHQRLKRAKPSLIKPGAQTYYKKITPITSIPKKNTDNKWVIASVSIEGKEVDPNTDGFYVHENISFSIDPILDFSSTGFFNIPVKYSEMIDNVEFIKITEKIPVLPYFEDYNAVLYAMQNNDLGLRQYVTSEGIIYPEGNPCVIVIKSRNLRKEPLKLQGVEVICNNKTRETNLCFDFLDNDNQPVNDFNIIQCKQLEMNMDNPVLCFKDHKMYECDVYGFFDSTETRKKWVPDESNFYDYTKNKMVSLPGFYSNTDDSQKQPKEAVVWVFEDKPNTSYQLDDIPKLKDTNDYIYSNGSSFFVTLPYEATYKECFSDNKIEVDYLVQAPEPHILVHNAVDAGMRKWFSGIYKKTSGDNYFWKRVGTSQNDTIYFDDKEPQLDIVFPTQPLSTQEIKKYCDAAQRFFTNFKADIHCCDQAVANELRIWNKLTKLNLSKLKLENGLTWNNVFTAVSTMPQLTSLHFKNNHPIADLINNWRNIDSDNRYKLTSDYYCNLAVCLNKLKNLQELHIQGLWLKPYTCLGKGCDGWIVSTQVARLTDIIAGNQGIKNIIQSICTLKFLENLSIDGIPNYGSSCFAQHTYGERTILLPYWALISPLVIANGYHQDIMLKYLVTYLVEQLAQIATLKTMSVYSPGGNCVDCFSKDFREKLDQSRKANKTLSKLDIVPMDLQ